jgi:hypothetical protein
MSTSTDVAESETFAEIEGGLTAAPARDGEVSVERRRRVTEILTPSANGDQDSW